MICWFLASASAADVLWATPPTDTDRSIVAAIPGITGTLDEAAFRAAATDVTEADLKALQDVTLVLDEARPYEAQLDGETVILNLIRPVVARVTLIRNDADRATLFRALAYQGFAVSRYFGDDLGTDPDAAEWRITFQDAPIEAPWADAIGLDPAREATPYEIAEAPQRLAYAERRRVLAQALPGLLTPPALPGDAEIRVDGRPTIPGPSGTIPVAPGRHFIHAQIGDHIIERWDVRIASGDNTRLQATVPVDTWTTFFSALTDGATVPAEIRRLIDATEPEVWFATTGPDGPTVFDPAGGTLRRVAPPGEQAKRVELDLGIGGGWMGGHDFYEQDPGLPATSATVNAPTIGGFAAVDLVLGRGRVGAGIDVWVPTGAAHIALTGDRRMRVRPTPHLSVGLSWFKATVGIVLPYHPAGGIRVEIPVSMRVEIRGSLWVAPAPTRPRLLGPSWEGNPLAVAGLGLGVRFP